MTIPLSKAAYCERQRMVPCSECWTGYAHTFPCKKGDRSFLLLISSFLDGLPSALPMPAASGLEDFKEPQLQAQNAGRTEITSRCLTPDQANRKGRPKRRMCSLPWPVLGSSSPPVPSSACLRFGHLLLGPSLQPRTQKPVTYCLGFPVSLLALIWIKPPPSKRNLLFLTEEANTSSL